MKQFIYTEDYNIINVDCIRYIFIDVLSDECYTITARTTEDGYCTKEIQKFSSAKMARDAMDIIMMALAQGQSYSVRKVREDD